MVNILISDRDIKFIEKILAERDESRERILEDSRIAIRYSSRAIVEIHRGDFPKAKENLKNVENYLKKVEKTLSSNSEFRYSGNIITAYQEYAEAKLLYYLIHDGKYLSLKEIGIEPIPYLLGLLDLIGELRRVVLNYLMKGENKKALEIFSLMERTYEDLFSIDHTAIIPNFRRKLDIVRRVVESTRGDIVTESRTISLERTIKEFEERLSKEKKSN